MMTDNYKIIKRPLITERSTALGERENKYLFEVDKTANKLQIAHAVEAIYGVKVTDVNTSVVRGKVKRVGRTVGKRPNWKKAIVTLVDGDTIDFFANV